MRQDDEYGDRTTPALYALFFEAVSSPKVREWMGWDESTSAFTNEETTAQFYSLITEPDADGAGGGKRGEAKITKYLEVRELRMILSHPEALSKLLDEESSFSEASAVVKAEAAGGSWRTAVKAATSAVDKIGPRELQKLEDTDLDALKDLVEAVTAVIQAKAAAVRG